MSEQFLGHSPNVWVAILTVVLAVIAAIQALIYFLQLRTTHRAERAYAYVDGISDLTDFGPDLAPTMLFDVKNSGRTPARILASNAAFVIPRKGKRLPPNFPKKFPLRTTDFWMITGRTLPFDVGFKEKITAEEFRAVLSGDLELFVFGRVEYRDRFQWWGRHYTNFCFVLDLRKRLPSDPKGTTHAFGFSIANNSYNDAS
jgi:hypothetical protein